MNQQDKFDRLREALPAIAEAVNAFESKEVQEMAFTALVAALGLPAQGPPTPGALSSSKNGSLDAQPLEETEADHLGDGDNGTKRTPPKRARKASVKKDVAPIRDLDLWPVGKQSIDDFVAAKKPNNNHERNAVAVYYLEQILEAPKITAGHVLAIYKHCHWAEPADMGNSLQVTASTRQFVNTTSMTDIKTTPQGRNLVDHRMPVEPKKATKL
jgi:hypothetical protein